ncbi:putative cytochrome P450 [Clohesyomyces aquaticus]|uniref:Putative cytochrome P450 n=1 Tax=Clohesyomyces aquaticus TaxID=1231657 RepID=A0A1Y1YWU3_9PLEO|nr:putative cytochrome P450 [Clohesyomyces aquaticus]
MRLVERAASACTSLSIADAYKVIAIILLLILVQRAAFRSQPNGIFPVWATLEIGITQYLLNERGWGRKLLSGMRRYGGSLYGISSRHQLLVNLTDVDRVMAQGHHTIDHISVQYTLLTRVFGAAETPDFKQKTFANTKELTAPVEQLFLNDAAATAALESANIPREVNSYVSFSSDSQYLKRWERSANVRFVDGDHLDKAAGVEVDLHSLTRDFGTCIAVPLFYGKDFLERCPTVIDDLWTFDNDFFPLMMIGVPKWAPFKVVREGKAARSRLHHELQALYKRIAQHQRGDAVDFDADMSDVSRAALGRSAVYERANFSLEQRGMMELPIYWGQNANTQPMLFWLLVYIYSSPGILDRVRDEISPYVELSSSGSVEITNMHISALTRNCQYLKACLFETYRLANDPTSIRYVVRPITIRDGDYKHDLKAGTFISAPHSLVSSDPLIFEEPEKFVPDRFLIPDATTGKSVARYGRLKPWGSGAAMCKGRTFAEKEILALAAAIISIWDMKPAEGEWRLPAMVPGTGVKRPTKDIRVVISRRVLSSPGKVT